MKFFLIVYISLLVFTPAGNSSDGYKWTRVAKPGSGCFQENCQAGKWPMALPATVAFENKLWIAGTRNSWSSADGINWSIHPKTDWGERHGMSYVFFRNKLWMMGGMKTWDDFKNDIWYSPDGRNWKKAVEHAEWQQRRGQHVVLFKNKLWLIGGALSSGKSNQTPTKFLNDVWSSEDGINWKAENPSAPWPAGDNGKVIVFKDQLWMISGAGKNNIWKSADGKTWTLVIDTVPWKERRGYGVQVFNNLIWVFGGYEMNDVWFSVDGAQWQQLNECAPWSPRGTEYSINFKNKIWVFSGKTGKEDSWAGDIWVLLHQTNEHQ